MQLIVKATNGVILAEDLKAYIEEKITEVIEGLPEPTVCEIMVTDSNGPKGGNDKEIHAVCTVPKVKNPVFAKVSSEDYFKSADLLQGKLGRALHNARR